MGGWTGKCRGSGVQGGVGAKGVKSATAACTNILRIPGYPEGGYRPAYTVPRGLTL